MTRFATILALTIGSLGTVLFAQDTTAPEKEPPPATAAPEQTSEPVEEDDGLGDLDDLLGLSEEEDDAVTPESATDNDRAALDRKLSNEELGDVIQQAVQLMDETAKRIKTVRDTGLTTQRMQEDIVRKLDILIEQAKQQQSSSSSSSSSSQQQQQQQQQQSPQDQQQQQGQGEQREGDGSQEGAPPGRTSEEFHKTLDTARASWGMLPARIRDLLMQGLNDQYSEMYGPVTEAYYRRIAEEEDKR